MIKATIYIAIFGFMIFFMLIPLIEGDVSLFQFIVGIAGFILMICMLIWIDKYIVAKIKKRLKIKLNEKKAILFIAIIICNLVSLVPILLGLLILVSYTEKAVDEGDIGVLIFSILALIYQGYSEVFNRGYIHTERKKE